MRKLTGTEKQIKYANDLIDRKIAEIRSYLNSPWAQTKSLDNVPARWDTPEKIELGLAKRREMNAEIEKQNAIAKETIKKLENINANAGDVIDSIRQITSTGMYNDTVGTREMGLFS
jgi:hypothetical protein